MMVGVAFMLFFKSDHTWAQAQLEFRQSVKRKFEEYRTAIKDAYKPETRDYKSQVPSV